MKINRKRKVKVKPKENILSISESGKYNSDIEDDKTSIFDEDL